MSVPLRFCLLALSLLLLAPQDADAYLIWMECDGLNVPDYVYGKDKAQAYDNYDTYVGSAASQCRIVLECPDPGWYGAAGGFMEGYSCGGTTRQAAADKAISECQKVGGQDCTGGHGWTDCDDGSSYIVQPHATMMPPKQKMFFSEGTSGGICGPGQPAAGSASPPSSGIGSVDQARQYLEEHLTLDTSDGHSSALRLEGCEGVHINRGKSSGITTRFPLSDVSVVEQYHAPGSAYEFERLQLFLHTNNDYPGYNDDGLQLCAGSTQAFYTRPDTSPELLDQAVRVYLKHCGVNPKYKGQ